MTRINTFAFVILLFFAGAGAVLAESPTSEQIVKSLKDYLGCCLRPRPFETADDKRINQALLNKEQLTVEDRRQLYEAVKGMPQLDLVIAFGYDSATPTQAGFDVVALLAGALQMPELKESIVLLISHTDARGSDAYVSSLSQRRAEAVRRILIEKFNIPAEKLVAVGIGKQYLKNPAHPLAPENGRLQVVNLGSQ